MTSASHLRLRAAAGTSAAFRHRMVVALLQRRQKLNPVARGFTLVELMIVVAIVGILTAVAFPNYLRARNAAAIGARVGEAVGFAKECSVLTVTGIGEAPNIKANEEDGLTFTGCNAIAVGGTITATWGAARAAGVNCLGNKSTDTSANAVITIDNKGGISCEI